MLMSVVQRSHRPSAARARARLVATIVSVSLALAACAGGADTSGLDSADPISKGGLEVEAVVEGRSSPSPGPAADAPAGGPAAHSAASVAEMEQEAGPAASPFAARIQALGTAPTLADLAPSGAPAGPVPRQLQLPTIGVVDAPVTSVGVEPNGDMEIPGAREVGWYQYGPTPGADGSAVLAAHIAFNGVDGVFDDPLTPINERADNRSVSLQTAHVGASTSQQPARFKEPRIAVAAA